MTSAIPTFCLVFQDWALCWRNCKGPGQGGAVVISDYMWHLCYYHTEMSTVLPCIENKLSLCCVEQDIVIFVCVFAHIIVCVDSVDIVFSVAVDC